MTSPRTFILGSRGSQLALRQSHLVREALLRHFPKLAVEIQIIKTKGDRLQQLALDASGDKGLFTGELEQALHRGEIDFAVHSLKDLPVVPAPGTKLGAILPRAVTHDTLIGSVRLEELPEGALVGTSSRRRALQLALHFPHLRTAPIRGNVETRIEKVRQGLFDATLLAEAGLARLGLTTERYAVSEELLVPAPGQAAIAVQLREDDHELADLLTAIHCSKTAYEVHLERSLLQLLGGGCALPLGAHALLSGEEVELRLFLANADGSKHYRDTLHFKQSETESMLNKLVSQLQSLVR